MKLEHIYLEQVEAPPEVTSFSPSNKPDLGLNIRYWVRLTLRPEVADDPHFEITQDDTERPEAWLTKLAARLDPARCRACPAGCRSCSNDESDCECYSHGDRHPMSVGAALDKVVRSLAALPRTSEHHVSPVTLEMAIKAVAALAKEDYNYDVEMPK